MAIHPKLTPAEFLSFERAQTDAKHEYLIEPRSQGAELAEGGAGERIRHLRILLKNKSILARRMSLDYAKEADCRLREW